MSGIGMQVDFRTERSVMKLYKLAENAHTLDQLRTIAEDVDWQQVTGPPDTFFNLGTTFSTYDLDEEAAEVWAAGLGVHPENVDLLCALFQHSYGLFGDMDSAAQNWKRLRELDKAKGPVRNWRYYSYGIRYLTEVQAPFTEVLEHLERGFRAVKTQNIANLYVSLAMCEEGFGYSDENARALDAIFREGLKKRVPKGHLLALILCKRVQRRAALALVDDLSFDTRPLLEEALRHCRLALTLYLEPERRGNHPIEEIWFHQARILVTLERYRDALPLLRTISATDEMARVKSNWFSTVAPLTTLCEEMLGERTQRKPPPKASQTPQLDHASESEIFAAIQRNPLLAQRFMNVLRKMSGDDE